MTIRQKTDRAVLPQQHALELAPADNLRVRTKRGAGAARRKTGAPGGQHGRGETSAVRKGGAGVTGASSGVSAGGVVPTTKQPRVMVLDKNHRPLQPCRPDRARVLLDQGRAVVHRRSPFVIRLKDRTVEKSTVDGVQLGVDPGSRTTGITMFTTTNQADTTTGDVAEVRDGIYLIEVEHRGLQIKKAMHARAQLRRGRRSRNLRYRAPRFDNRTRPKGWLSPSLQHRVDGTGSWVNRLRRWAPVTAVHYEAVRFDTQKLENPEITGVEYQQGTLLGYEVREYVFEKWGRICVYCDAVDVVLNLDHVIARANGGSDRVSNLVPSCVPCNDAKDNLWVQDFLAHDPTRLAKITRGLKKPLADAAAVNSTRRALHRALASTGLPVHASSGGRTKYNRVRNHIPKTHALDALCVGEVEKVGTYPATTHVATSTGRGTYQRAMPDKYGFPRSHRSQVKVHHGYATGDMVRAVVPSGKKRGTHTGRVAVRSSGSFLIYTPAGNVDGVNHKYLTLIQRGDGYRHTTRETA